MLLVLLQLGSQAREQITFLNFAAPALPALQSSAILYAVLAAIACSVALLGGAAWPMGGALSGAVLTGLTFFAAPALLLRWSENAIPATTSAALLTTVAIFTQVLEPYLMGDEAAALPRAPYQLLAALIAVSGALCVFPVGVPATLKAAVGFAVVIVAAAILAAGTCVAVRESVRQPLVPFAAIAAVTASLTLFAVVPLLDPPVWSVARLGPELLFLTLFRLPGLVLLFWLLRRLRPIDLASRSILSPLFQILLGMAFLQMNARPRTWLGLAMMFTGAGYLLFAPGKKAEPVGISLRSR